MFSLQQTFIDSAMSMAAETVYFSWRVAVRGSIISSTTQFIFLPLSLDSEQSLQEVTWRIVAVTQPTLPGAVAVLIRVRVWLDQLQPCGSTAVDQSDLAPAHTNTTTSVQRLTIQVVTHDQINLTL